MALVDELIFLYFLYQLPLIILFLKSRRLFGKNENNFQLLDLCTKAIEN
jgi:hypothetical protein